MMIYFTWLIWIPTRWSYRKTAFDAHADQFRELLRYAEMFVNHNASERPVFTFVIGAIPSLFYAATKCRLPSIRRRALALLKKAPKKESLLGADSSAEVAYQVISIEGRGLGLPDPAVYNDEADATDIDDTLRPAEGHASAHNGSE